MTVLASRPESRGRSVEVEVVTRADPARAWEAWTEPARIQEWLADRATGAATPGNTVTWSFDHPQSEMIFQVSPLTTPGRLVLKPMSGVSGYLEIVVGASHDGTRVKLVHGGLPDDAQWDPDFHAMSASWRVAMAVFRYYVEFHFGQSRQGFHAARAGRFPHSRLMPLFREPSGLQEWLTVGGSLGTPGGRVHLVLKNGEMLRGDMLADTGSDLAMAWDEIGGILELRALPVQKDRDMRSVCVTGWGWGISAERAREIERDLSAALERLERAAESLEIGQPSGTAKKS